jgi:hypothetical protein
MFSLFLDFIEVVARDVTRRGLACEGNVLVL